MRCCLDVVDFSADEVRAALELARREPAELGAPLAGEGAALIFEKPSNRTRHSMEMAVVQLGGHPVYTRGEEVGFDERERVEDIARVLAGYHRILAARVYDHRVVERLAATSEVAVVNLMSDHSHPLQAFADALTMLEQFGELAGRRIAWIGDYTNVARSLAEVCVLLGAEIAIACPSQYAPTQSELARLNAVGVGTATLVHRPAEAVKGAVAVHTDTWYSMGSEATTAERERAFAGYTVDDELLAMAAPDAVFMHCLPAQRGVEVAASVIDGERSVVFQQARNRMHAARGVLAFLLGVRLGDHR